MKLFRTFALFAAIAASSVAMAQKYEITSPDGKIKVTVENEKNLTWSIAHEQTQVITPSAIGLSGYDAKNKKKAVAFGNGIKVKNAAKSSKNTSFATPFYKKAKVENNYNGITLVCQGDFDIEFRAYNDGAAYRIINKRKAAFNVKDETVNCNFADDYKAFIPYVNDNRSGERYCYSFESYYDESKLSEMYADSLSITPLMVCLPDGKKAVCMEAGVENYPGLFLKKGSDKANSLVSEFAPVPTEEIIAGHARLNLIPVKRADYIATVGKSQSLPWRVVLVTTDDSELLNNDMAQRLAPECRIADTSWIRPGKVSWDWWNTCNLTGVDFKAGMNTKTYKYYIDFAAKNNLEYIIIDEGWSSDESLIEDLSADINLAEIIAHGKEKGVGVILWSSWRNAKNNTDAVFKHYADMGIKGFKVDFFDRDDQPVLASAYQIAAIAAKHHLLLDFHGMKPCGIQRAYPNIVNFEGVKGLENSKWEPVTNNTPLHDFPRYDVTAPYLRQVAGPMDYTPGATVNAQKWLFRSVNDHPMSMGTRAHQVAMYTAFEAPLQMLADSPSKYMKEQETTDFISQIPTTFEQTVALKGEIGEYLAVARCKNGVWYVCAMTNWNARTLPIDLSFLGEGEWKAEIFADGVNANNEATDYKKCTMTVNSSTTLQAEMASGGGWSAIIKK